MIAFIQMDMADTILVLTKLRLGLGCIQMFLLLAMRTAYCWTKI